MRSLTDSVVKGIVRISGTRTPLIPREGKRSGGVEASEPGDGLRLGDWFESMGVENASAGLSNVEIGNEINSDRIK